MNYYILPYSKTKETQGPFGSVIADFYFVLKSIDPKKHAPNFGTKTGEYKMKLIRNNKVTREKVIENF